MKKQILIAGLLLLIISCKKSAETPPSNVTTAPTANGGTYTTLFSFNESNGAYPYGSLVVSGNTLYGMTSSGGANGDGTIFSISNSGSAFTIMHNFSGGTADGNQPYGDLTLLSGSLFGMTKQGGANNKGVLFSINLDGSGFTLLHTFGGGDDGAYPQGDLTVSGTTLYGTTTQGGANGSGCIFSIDASGANYNRFYDLNTANGYTPLAGITLSYGDTAIYGTTSLGGGAFNGGVVFSYKPGLMVYQNLIVFNSVMGLKPEGSLLLSGTKLYGMASAGGKNNVGAIFSYDVLSKTYTDMFDFDGGDGASPYGALILNGSTMYGMTNAGGEYLAGNIFTINTNDSSYVNIFSFGAGTFGAYPQGSLVLSKNVLYGMTSSGGVNGYGTIFSCSL